MKIWKWIGIVAASIAVVFAIVWLCLGDKISLLYTSFNSFKEENLAYTFQHTPEIQPTVTIGKSEQAFSFLQGEPAALADGFYFDGAFYDTDAFMTETKTSAMLVIQDDVIRYENYFFGGDENTVFVSNSMGKSFVSALMGIAAAEGYIDSVEDPLGKYIPEFVGTELENIPIKACLQMASGIDFDEDTDMSGYSLRTLLGTPAMKLIARCGVQEAPYTYRRYLSINTDILGQILKNTTGQGLGAYMEEKLWKKIGAEHDAYWTLSNGSELANGGLSISLRDYARFARLYLKEGNYNGEQICVPGMGRRVRQVRKGEPQRSERRWQSGRADERDLAIGKTENKILSTGQFFQKGQKRRNRENWTGKKLVI